jgi:hypothetical protein
MYIYIAFVSPITIVIFTVIWPLATSVKMNKSNQINGKESGCSSQWYNQEREG